MKRFFLPAITASLVLFAACNDASSNSKEASAKDSSTSSSAATVDSAPTQAGGNQLSKSGITLSASNEVPVNNSTASGTADVKYDKSSHMLTYTVNYAGLTDKPTMAHIHGPAPKGVNAGVKKDLTGVLVKEQKGSFTDSVKIDGSAIKEDSLLSGFYYINIHTPKNPGGEIRGQIQF
jgi:hypothetical protein